MGANVSVFTYLLCITVVNIDHLVNSARIHVVQAPRSLIENNIHIYRFILVLLLTLSIDLHFFSVGWGWGGGIDIHTILTAHGPCMASVIGVNNLGMKVCQEMI